MSQVGDIIRYAREGSWLFHAPDGTAYATVEVEEHLETHADQELRFSGLAPVALSPTSTAGPREP